ncbi:methylenetetrahydrofolate reductase [Demequina sp. SYSU T00039]|uniref:Methylenetetrahydrofolate reductase n=1 Tax=Demequina lignilytica TaxID=3051663 RepID=A0AAW7M2R4_9MICO|nr:MULTISPECIES: methylenetetrahydrofolate reductase [unclassified Demequina]MDN4477738.1 methylenetetrahydrofolate reductase [Demequina sp. SYSU T00039-1]MDN4487647.1 methylenetetrahydrofolate reductase [Demequina sp. SYSU T00039]MDN4491358.1 methylenetetrahydrofolate reductase [Demequina sp. SYSU T00068]
MTIRDLLALRRPTLSYELFPPRTPAAESTLEETMRLLTATRPDFISITYGASGSTQSTSRAVVRGLAEHHVVPPLAHLTCVGQSRAELTRVIEDYLAEGVRDFLALRGDPPQGQTDWRPHPEGLLYASDLVTLLREVAGAHGIRDLSIGVTAFPAQHAQEGSRGLGLEVLEAKVRAGADFAITQVFYEVEQYARLVADAAARGLDLPIVPEVMPLVSSRRAHRAEELTEVATPPALLAELEAAPDADAARAVGVAHAAALSRGLVDAGAPGIHIITFNQSAAALALVDAIGLART